ncbi:hypothetical protein [Streptomyces sp. NPDC050738]|uniref:ATP-binding protein n=1 Tax=Streptomyces sp. NPDC050738 TaxID=3154744 RepID=UPI0034140021
MCAAQSSPQPKSQVYSLLDRLSSTRLVTLTGPAGVGKSHLAARIAESIELPVFRADLSACQDAALVPHAVAAALHTSPEQGADPVLAVLQLLSRRRGLLLLETCEHVRTGCAYLVGRLHDHCPQLQILTTSRQALGVPGEQSVALRPLPPEQTVDMLTEKAATQGVDLPNYWGRLIAGRLDGDPLSILLAARSLRLMPAQRLYASLAVPGGRFTVLTDGPKDPPRHRTLLRAIDWSHELCTRAERLLWARISAFEGTFTEEQVRTVFAGGAEFASLVRSSVVIPQAGTSRTGAVYRLPLAHREYGQLRLAGLGD